MSKKRFVKFLAMALVLVMLTSVTAFGATDSKTFYSLGVSAQAYLYGDNNGADASTSYDDYGSLYVSVTFHYYRSDASGRQTAGDSLDRTGSEASVYCYGSGLDVDGIDANGTHRVNSVSRTTSVSNL